MINLTSDGKTRRAFLTSAGMAGVTLLAGCASKGRDKNNVKLDKRPAVAVKPKAESISTLYPAMPNELFPIPAVPKGRLKPKYQRRRIKYDTAERPGTVIVDTKNFYLYHIEKGGYAMRYGVGLGRAGFEWSGRAHIAWKRKWPVWTPPDEMIERQPELAKWSSDNGGMPPGLDNPLGSRALYIHQGNVDTLYRLHGSPEISSIGKAVSSGCVRLVNQDVIHLYDRVRSGSPILVM